jgi:hypothetical protein
MKELVALATKLRAVLGKFGHAHRSVDLIRQLW